MAAHSDSTSSLPGRWAAALVAKGAADAGARVEDALAVFMDGDGPGVDDAPLLRERLLALTRRALVDPPAVEPLLAIDAEGAAARFAQEGVHPPEEIFARRWTQAAPFSHDEVVAELGHGGMGAVYQARQTELDRPRGASLLRHGIRRWCDAPCALRGAGGLAPANALHVATQVCDALTYAHSEGVIHRDHQARQCARG